MTCFQKYKSECTLKLLCFLIHFRVHCDLWGAVVKNPYFLFSQPLKKAVFTFCTKSYSFLIKKTHHKTNIKFLKKLVRPITF